MHIRKIIHHYSVKHEYNHNALLIIREIFMEVLNYRLKILASFAS